MPRYLTLAAAAVLAACVLAGQVPESSPSPAQRRVDMALKRIKSESKSWQAVNDLAFAYCRWARDAEDLGLYDKAESSLRRSFELSPGNYDARKLEITVVLGEHDIVRGLKLATELNHQVPDDIAGWALLVDANVALGNYDSAKRAAQWILDLRPGSSLGFVKAAQLREIYGDPEGAAEFYDEAGKRTGQSDLEERAWLLTQNARQQLMMGKPERAEDMLKQALQLFADSQLALAGLASVRRWQEKYTEAAELLARRYRAANNPGNLYDWAEALDRAGQAEQARSKFQEFEKQAIAESQKTYNWNRDLIAFYADHSPNPAKAVSIAEREVAVRQDSPSLAAYAWALYKYEKFGEAKQQMDKALQVGVRDPTYFCHAAQIAAKVNDAAAAARFTKELADFAGTYCPTERPLRAGR